MQPHYCSNNDLKVLLNPAPKSPQSKSLFNFHTDRLVNSKLLAITTQQKNNKKCPLFCQASPSASSLIIL